MPNLFSTFGRAALVAIGLAVAPAAFAQSAFTCAGGMTPIFTGVGTQSVEATCGLTCSSGQVIAVNAGVASCVTGGGGPVAPAGCKIVASPTSGGPAAKDVTLTLSCTGGDLPINVAWLGGTAPGNCPTSINALSNNTCQVLGVAATTTWTVSQFSNTVGNGTGNSNKSATYTYTAGGGGSGNFANCPSGSTTSNNFYPQTGTGNTYDINGNGVSAGQWLSVKITPPANANTTSDLQMFGSGTYGGAPVGVYAISETACDVDNPILDMRSGQTNFTKGKLKYVKGYLNPNFDFGYNYGPAGSQGNAATSSGTRTMEIGKTYYLNIRVDACLQGGCGWTNIKLP